MKALLSVLTVATLLALAACDKSSDVPKPHVGGDTATLPSATSSANPSPGVSSAETKDPSIPSSAMPAPASGSTESQRMANPQGEMSKQEESTAMPKPSQANDHSSTALEDQKK